MGELFVLYIIFSILFIIEYKPINILMLYIGLTLILAIILSSYPPLLQIEGQYLSYILILVQISALTILFGFIIMIYPRQTDSYAYSLIIGIVGMISIGLILIYYYNITCYNITLENSVDLSIDSKDITLLRKLGEILYTDNNNIIKLLILTLILLLAIIGLFFIL